MLRGSTSPLERTKFDRDSDSQKDNSGKDNPKPEFDDSRPGNNVPVTGQDLRAALDAVLSGDQPDPNQTPSMGCNIKWK